MKQLSDIDIRISYAQAYNCACLIVANLYNSKDQEDVKADIERWQAYFYDKLTRGYIEKFAPQEITQGKSKAERSEIVADEFGSDAENLI